MPAEIFIALKFLVGVKKRFVSVIGFFAVFGVLLSVATLIVVIGVMTGFHHELKKRIISITPHVVVKKFFDETIEDPEPLIDTLAKLPAVKKASPFVVLKVVVKNGNYVDGGILKGVEPESFVKAGDLKDMVVMGKYDLDTGSILLGAY